MPNDTRHLAETAAAVLARMAGLGIDQAELVRRSGVSDTTVRQVMRGAAIPKRPATRHKIALALGWTPMHLTRASRRQLLVHRPAVTRHE